MSQAIVHRVEQGVSGANLATTLDTVNAEGWQVISVIYAGGTYTIVAQRKSPTTYGVP